MPPRKRKITKKRKKSESPGPSVSPSQDIAGTAGTPANHVAAADPKEQVPKTTFMDLPTEIRLRIYGYVLGEEEPVRIVVQPLPMRLGHEIRRRPAPFKDVQVKAQRGAEWDRKTKKYVWPPAKYISILIVNKEIFSESEPVLYSENTFVIESSCALKDFIDAIGKHAQHLRYIRLGDGGYQKSYIRGALQALCVAGGLRKLEFAHRDLCKSHRIPSRHAFFSLSPDHLAEDCKALALTLRQSYQDRNLVGDVPSIFSIYADAECYWCDLPPEHHEWRYSRDTVTRHHWRPKGGYQCTCECSKAQSKNATMQSVLRAAIAKDLAEEAA